MLNISLRPKLYVCILGTTAEIGLFSIAKPEHLKTVTIEEVASLTNQNEESMEISEGYETVGSLGTKSVNAILVELQVLESVGLVKRECGHFVGESEIVIATDSTLKIDILEYADILIPNLDTERHCQMLMDLLSIIYLQCVSGAGWSESEWLTKLRIFFKKIFHFQS